MWNLDYFHSRFAKRDVEVQFGRNADEHVEMHKRTMCFDDYIDLVKNAGTTNDFYSNYPVDRAF